MLGLPFAFASHFAPEALLEALEIYRDRFEPSQQLDRPYAMVACNVVAADTEAEARRLFTSPQQSFVNLLRGARGQLRPPIDDIETLLVAGGEGAGVADDGALVRRRGRRGRGAAARLRSGDAAPTRSSSRREFSTIAARLRSYELLARAFAARSDRRGACCPENRRDRVADDLPQRRRLFRQV